MAIKAWARLYRAFYTEDMSSQALEITELIKCFTNAPNVLVSTPIAESHPNPANGPPHHFLISGLTQQAHDQIVNTGVIATETMIILTLPFDQPLPEYIGTLENFSLGDTTHNKLTVAEAVKSALATNPGITMFVNDHLPRTNSKALVRGSLGQSTSSYSDNHRSMYTWIILTSSAWSIIGIPPTSL
ncbi:hypothetical protein BDZ94DRAFT_1315792 [Collybia nuda]|uniref:Uncharacterized protein n=1 Tax=Collybia nuda TaxID=64659 RepID=A0A9P5XRU7_9AGAR|nr:hypothetical protein BDZ94DRAFT_1315792 [Collybia nuda]